MATTAERVIERVHNVMSAAWNVRTGMVVPKTEDVTLRDGAVELEAATYLYTDLRQSTLLVQRYDAETAARMMRAFLGAACDVIRAKNGHIRSFDGDRVMGVFIGDSQRNNAVAAAMGINWACDRVINPALTDLLTTQGYQDWYPSHGTGIDHGQVLIVRGGVRDNSDLVSVGRAPNVAAKLSSFGYDSGLKTIRITGSVFSGLNGHRKFVNGTDGTEIFEAVGGAVAVGPHNLSIYHSGYLRTP